jgi:hypothetical protein
METNAGRPRAAPRVRTPVRRPGAERYLFITLLTFAGSVGLTRMFLELTGYPQLGGGGLHIAHVLWGGLLLFAAALLPLIWANRWVYDLGAGLAGVGVGLFIDEVGKFLTSTNDYFFPAAAPIAYAFFLLTVLVYLRLRRPGRRDVRRELYQALDGLEEWLDHDLDRKERSRLQADLKWIASQDSDPGWARLGAVLEDFLKTEARDAPGVRRSLAQRRLSSARMRFRRWLTEGRLRMILIGGLSALSLLALKNPAEVLLAGRFPALSAWLAGWTAGRNVEVGTTVKLMAARVSLEIAAGAMLVGAVVFLGARRPRIGAPLGIGALLLLLTVANLLVFYYEQFSTIVTAGVQFAALLALLYYRREFVE